MNLRQLFCKHKNVKKDELFERQCPGFIPVTTIVLTCLNCNMRLDYEESQREETIYVGHCPVCGCTMIGDHECHYENSCNHEHKEIENGKTSRIKLMEKQ